MPKKQVNYDDFVNDVQAGDVLLVDGGIISFKVVAVSGPDVEVRGRWRPCLFGCVMFFCLVLTIVIAHCSSLLAAHRVGPHLNSPPPKTKQQCEVVDSGTMTSRRHLNVRGKSATLPAVTDKDWHDLAFGVEQGVDFFALSFVQVRFATRLLQFFVLGARLLDGKLARKPATTRNTKQTNTKTTKTQPNQTKGRARHLRGQGVAGRQRRAREGARQG
jgi:pyruvate kinase